MALIETTDDFFSSVTKQLNHGPLEENEIITRLDGLYLHLTDTKPHTQKSSLIIWDTFEQFVDAELVENIQTLVQDEQYSTFPNIIKTRYLENILFQQSTILFLFWLLIKKKNRLMNDWPLQRDLLQPLANDLGINTWDD